MKRTVNLREMSAASPATTAPSQESQTRKIMMDLQQEKKRLRMLQQGSASVGSLPAKHPTSAVNPPPQFVDSSTHLSITQRNALQMAHATSFGYFIPQSSSFGNIILPVIPRVGPNE